MQELKRLTYVVDPWATGFYFIPDDPSSTGIARILPSVWAGGRSGKFHHDGAMVTSIHEPSETGPTIGFSAARVEMKTGATSIAPGQHSTRKIKTLSPKRKGLHRGAYKSSGPIAPIQQSGCLRAGARKTQNTRCLKYLIHYY